MTQDAKTVFGVTADGTTDDTVAMRAYISACNANNLVVTVPEGTVLITDSLIKSGEISNGFTMRGVGRNSKILNKSSPAKPVFVLADGLTYVDFSNFSVIGDTTTPNDVFEFEGALTRSNFSKLWLYPCGDASTAVAAFRHSGSTSNFIINRFKDIRIGDSASQNNGANVGTNGYDLMYGWLTNDDVIVTTHGTTWENIMFESAHKMFQCRYSGYSMSMKRLLPEGHNCDTIRYNSTATAGTSTTLTDSARSWMTNELKNKIVQIDNGNGLGQVRTIASNTATVITVNDAFDITPDVTSEYVVTDGAVIQLEGGIQTTEISGLYMETVGGVTRGVSAYFADLKECRIQGLMDCFLQITSGRSVEILGSANGLGIGSNCENIEYSLVTDSNSLSMGSVANFSSPVDCRPRFLYRSVADAYKAKGYANLPYVAEDIEIITDGGHNTDITLDYGLWIFALFWGSGPASMEAAIVHVGNNSAMSITQKNTVGAVDWTNPSGRTLRITDTADDKVFYGFGIRLGKQFSGQP